MKILVQNQVTVTLEMNGAEAEGLLNLLAWGCSQSTVDKLKLTELYMLLNDKLVSDKDINFESKATLKK